MDETALLDVSEFRCPQCSRYYADASWRVIELEPDIECGSCHETFNIKNQLTDCIMLRYTQDDRGKMTKMEMPEHISAKVFEAFRSR